MVATASPPLSSLLRRTLMVAAICVLVVAAIALTASGASARTLTCLHLDASVVSLAHHHIEHASACLVGHVHSVRHLPVRLPGGKI